MRLALTTWNGRVSPVCDVARHILVLDIEDGRVTARHAEALPGTELQEQAARLRALGLDVLICGAISTPMRNLLAADRTRLIPFTSGRVEDVLAAWHAGGLPSPALSMPGCCGGRRRQGGRARRRGGRSCESVGYTPSDLHA